MKAETDLYCPKCGSKIHEKGDELRSLIFPRQEERCRQCSTMLRRRTGGGQHNPWNFVTLELIKRCEICSQIITDGGLVIELQPDIKRELCIRCALEALIEIHNIAAIWWGFDYEEGVEG